MRAIVAGVATPLTVTRAYSVTVSSASIADADGAGSAACAVTNDTANVSLAAAAARGADTLAVSSAVTPGRQYALVGADGRVQPVRVDAYDSGTQTATLSQRLAYACAAGALRGVESTITATAAADWSARLALLDIVLSDGNHLGESVLVATRRLMSPITVDDVLTRYPRLRDRRGYDADIARIIDDAITRTRARLWTGAGVVLDDVATPWALRDLLLLECGLTLLDGGYDPFSMGDRAEARREIERAIQREVVQVSGAANLWTVTGTTRDTDPTRISGLRMLWRR